MKHKSQKMLQIALIGSVALLSSCATQKEQETVDSNVDFSILLSFNPFTPYFYGDLNEHPASLLVEEHTGKVVDYVSSPLEQESTDFLMMMSARTLPDLLRVDLEKEYFGGASAAIEDGMILDITDLVSEYAPNFMRYLESDPSFVKSAYSDEGALVQFGATLTQEQLRGLPYYGPVINKTYLDEVGLEIPVTLDDWEEMLLAFREIGVDSPLSFGAETDFQGIYDCFASAYGVTAGATFFQENGVVKFSPFEAGYYDFILLLRDWYEKGLLDSGFHSKNQDNDLQNHFETGKIGATVAHINVPITAANTSQNAGNPMEFVAVPYPVLEIGNQVHTRHFTPDFTGNPIFVYANAENPEELISWVDYFYSEEGEILSNWGVEGETFQVDDFGNKVFTDFVANNPESNPPALVLAELVLQENAVVKLWDYESQFLQDERQKSSLEVWKLADYDNTLPQTMTYSLEERKTLILIVDDIENYVHDMTLKFITGQTSMDKYPTFLETLTQLGANDYLNMTQSALNRYNSRG